ncbi:hypothetical protein DSECCO2_571490 [anaerobic digester metagenome]
MSVVALLWGMMSGCAEQKSPSADTTIIGESDKVEVYYFHNARRCATCEAVEAQSKAALEEIYGDTIVMLVYNLEDKEGSGKAAALDVSGQTLLIVSGSTRVDITNEAFLYARTNPEKFKQLIKENIDPFL